MKKSRRSKKRSVKKSVKYRRNDEFFKYAHTYSNKMSYYINGFIEEDTALKFMKYLCEKIFKTILIRSYDMYKSDILIESHFNKTVLYTKKWKYSLFFSGERYNRHNLDYTINLCSCDPCDENMVECPLFLLYYGNYQKYYKNNKTVKSIVVFRINFYQRIAAK